MIRLRGKHACFNQWLVAGAAAIALAGGTGQAAAQAAQAPAGRTARIDVDRGDLSRALTQLGRQAGVQIAFLPDRVRGRRARALHGTFTVEAALDRLLAGTGLRFQRSPGGSYIVGGPTEQSWQRARDFVADRLAAEGKDAEGKAQAPEILVIGRRNWNLNLDIPRTADDAQPYVVFDRAMIQRSGATNLDDFFRNFLGANNGGSTSTQVGTSKGQSFVNLRGLGSASTLVLVDGRRYAQANTGDGAFSQASVNGIPLDAIERIEVLASSASGIYGSNAVGGVINIIMRRDYHGIEATAYYGNTSRLDAFENRLSINGSFPIEGGRTRLSFTGSWQKTGGLQEGDRDYISRGRALLLANQPNYFNTLSDPVQGATPNIVSADGSSLVLKPQYGGAALGSRITFVPVGFRGIGQDGVAALLANAGKQNLALSPTPTSGPAGDGTLSPLLSPTQSYSGSFTARRDFNKWLTLYGEFGYSHYESRTLVSPGAGNYTLPAGSADNPFNQAIRVSVPITGDNRYETSRSTTKRALAGAIVSLPLGWHAAIDLAWNWSTYNVADAPASFDQATSDALNTGTISVLRDVAQYPVTLHYLDSPSIGLLGPSHSFSRSYTLKLSGPLPLLRLWGGKPAVTLQVEQDKQSQGQYASFSNNVVSSTIAFTPARSQRTDSVYGEIRFPIFGADNHIPLFRELELQVAGRYDRYVGIGSNASLNCFPGTSTIFAGPLPQSAYTAACPVAGAQPVFATTRNGSTNPTVALRWAVTRDIAFRGSYSTGYLPLFLNSVVKADAGIPGTLLAGQAFVNVTDPARGNTLIGKSLLGIFQVLPATIGGNPDIDPQTSISWSFGTILTPHWVPGLRVSVDWSRITQNNVYFQPSSLVGNGNIPGGQQAFNDFLAAHPERFVRDTNPASFGPYAVGPILSADLSTANVSYARSEAVDFAASYDTTLRGGHLAIQASATWLRQLRVQTTPSARPTDATGVVSNGFLGVLSALGGVKWKGNGSIVYSAERWTAGARVRYFGPYWLNTDHSVQVLQGSAKIGAQAYLDLFGTFRLFPRTELRAGVNNVLDRSPPINATTGLFYSYFGDPRRANFYVSINQKF
jgi:outer membrane receptor protein involved in Fe transport